MQYRDFISSQTPSLESLSKNHNLPLSPPSCPPQLNSSPSYMTLHIYFLVYHSQVEYKRHEAWIIVSTLIGEKKNQPQYC